MQNHVIKISACCMHVLVLLPIPTLKQFLHGRIGLVVRARDLNTNNGFFGLAMSNKTMKTKIIN